MLKLKRIVASLVILGLTACASAPQQTDVRTERQKQRNDTYANSVKVTNMAGNSGGTGIVLRSRADLSLVLTNAHVCEVVENGGQVTGVKGTYTVAGYKKSQVHDLCLIKVNGNLGYNTSIASKEPTLYYEAATISGHPSLMPNVLTKGQFSGREIISVMMGVRECTEEDMETEEGSLMCIFLGGIPLIKQFESVLVSATIMPGSSGSGVYNSDGELCGVAFAGQGELGYAWTVPYNYVRAFLLKEQRRLPYIQPGNMVSLTDSSSRKKKKRETTFRQNLSIACADEKARKVFEKLCVISESGRIQ